MESKNEDVNEKGIVTFHGNEANLLASYDVTGEMLKKLKAKGNRLLKKDVTDKENYVLVNQGIVEVRTLRLKVEEKRKDLKADALKWGKMVDGEASRITEALVAIENPLKLLKKGQDDAEKERKEKAKKIEQERIDGINKKIADIDSLYMACDGKDMEYVNEVISRLNDTVIDAATFGEFIEDAQKTITATLDRLSEYLVRRQKYEDEQADVAIQQAAQKKRDAEFKKQQDELKAGQAKLAAAQKIIDDKEEEERQKKLLAEAKERDRKAKLADEKEREKQMKRTVKAVSKVVGTDALAMELLELVTKNKIPNLRYEQGCN